MSDIETGQTAAVKDDIVVSVSNPDATAVGKPMGNAPDWIKEEHITEVSANGSKTKVTIRHYADGRIREIREPIPAGGTTPFATTSSLNASNVNAPHSSGTTTTDKAATHSHSTKGNSGNCNMKCLTISTSITGGFAVLFWILLAVLPIVLFLILAILFTIAAAVLGIVMCSKGCKDRSE